MIVMLCLSAVSCVSEGNQGNTQDENSGANHVDVVPTELKIYRMPNKTEYGVGEEFKLTGMVMQLVFSDGTSKYLAPNKCERDKTGPLTIEDTQVTFSYMGLSVVLPILVTNKCEEHAYALVSIARRTNYVVGEKFYNPYKALNDYPVKAVCSQCGAEGEITSCTVGNSAMKIDTTSVPVTAVVNDVEIVGEIPVKVFESRTRLEAEAYFENAVAEMKNGTVNYDKTQNYALYDESILDTSGLCTKKLTRSVELGTRKTSGHYIEFHFFADEAGVYELVFSGLFTNVDAYVGGGAARVADSIVNRLLTFTVNGRAIDLSDDVIIHGVGADDGESKSILGQYTYVSLGTVELFEGENIIRISQKNYSGYLDLASDHNGNRYAATKVDAIEIYPVK